MTGSQRTPQTPVLYKLADPEQVECSLLCGRIEAGYIWLLEVSGKIDEGATYMPEDFISGYRVLLFGESATAMSAAACLRGCAITVIAAADEPRIASLSRFVHNRILLPDRSKATAIQCLQTIRSKTADVLLIFPCSDAWIDTLAEDLPSVLQCGRMLPATADDCALTLDKFCFARKVSEIGLPQPVVYQARAWRGWIPEIYPFVLKPYSTYKYENTTGAKASVIRDAAEWNLFDKQILDNVGFIAQEYVEGASLSVCFCTTADGRLATAYATEKIHFGAMKTGSRVATVNRPDAVHLASEFVRLSGFVGFAELELIDSDCGPLLLELNARPWSQVVMSDALKLPVLKMAIDLMLDKKLEESSKVSAEPLEWVAWDDDLLYCRRIRRSGKSVRALTTSKRIYAQSFLRDPIPALIYALNYSRLGPGKVFHRYVQRVIGRRFAG